MSDPRIPVPANAFGSAAGDYERARPSYPPASIDLLRRHVGLGPGARVCDLAAGTGKLTRLLAATALAAPLIAALTARLVAPAARLARRLVAEPLELTIERRQLLTEPSYARQLLAQLLRGLTVAACSSEPIRQAIESPCNRLAFTLCGRLSPTRRIARLPVGARGVAHTLRQPLFVEILGSLAQCIFLPLVGFA